MRGSIPTHWSQVISKLPKPVISIDIPDPFAITAGNYFSYLTVNFQYLATFMCDFLCAPYIMLIGELLCLVLRKSF
jgi:hypothetical protein